MLDADALALGGGEWQIEQNAAIRFSRSRLVVVAKETAGLTETEASKAPLLHLRDEELMQARCEAAARLAAKLVNVDAQSRLGGLSTWHHVAYRRSKIGAAARRVGGGVPSEGRR